MINGYRNPYDILGNPDSPFLRDVKAAYRENIIERGENACEDVVLKAINQFIGAGFVSGLYQGAGSIVIKCYCELCNKYIEEEYNIICASPEILDKELKMSFLVFSLTSKVLDNADYNSSAVSEGIKFWVRALRHFSITEAIQDSLEDDMRTGKLSKWYNFAMNSYMCLLAHLWEGMPAHRDRIIMFAQYANKTCAEDICTINSLLRFKFDDEFLTNTILDYCRYQTSAIQRYSEQRGKSAVRYGLIRSLLEQMPSIIESVSGE